MIFTVIILGLILAGIIKYLLFRPKKKITAILDSRGISFTGRYKEKRKPVKTIKGFIPYYKWHGWKNGLQPSTKKDILYQHYKDGLITKNETL